MAISITLENIDELNALLKVEVKEEDYLSDVENLLKDYRKKANLPGFRAGKTPMGLIKKKYGISAKVERINQMLTDELNNYLQNQELNFLGNPLPVMQDINWESEKDFVFEYEMGLIPEFEVKISKRNKLNYYKIAVDDTMVDKYADDIALRYGKMSQPDAATNGDMVYGEFQELDAEGNVVEGGIQNKATVMIDKIDSETIKAQFIDSGAETRIELNPKAAFTQEADLIAMLGVDATQVADLSENFAFIIETVQRMVAAELNEELFGKLYPDNSVTTEEAFRAKLREEAEGMYSGESDMRLKNDAVDYLMNKITFDLPDGFLKKWIKANQENPITDEDLEKEYDNYKKSLRWQIIEGHIAKENEIKIENDELKAETTRLVKLQMAQYGQSEVDENTLNGIVENVMSNEEEKKNIAQRVFDGKMINLFKEKFKIEETLVSMDEFIASVQEK